MAQAGRTSGMEFYESMYYFFIQVYILSLASFSLVLQ